LYQSDALELTTFVLVVSDEHLRLLAVICLTILMTAELGIYEGIVDLSRRDAHKHSSFRWYHNPSRVRAILHAR
jgi:hypothetical protein